MNLGELVTLSLISDRPKQKLAEKLGIEPNCKAFIQYVMKEKCITEEQAKNLIMENMTLLRMMFILA